jgi:DNA replication protein DnaC
MQGVKTYTGMEFKALAKTLCFSHETIDHTLDTASVEALSAIGAMIEYEQVVREKNKKARLLKRAKFPTMKSVDGYSFDNVSLPNGYGIDDMLSLDFIRQSEDFIFFGKTGRGKSHLAIALGILAVNAGFRTRFFVASDLVMKLTRAKREDKLDRLIEELKKEDLLIIDELGYVPFDMDGARLLYQVICNSYEQSSVIFTTNIEFSKWGTIFADEKMTSSLVDRIVHHGRLVEFGGPSYRMDTALMLGKDLKSH